MYLLNLQDKKPKQKEKMTSLKHITEGEALEVGQSAKYLLSARKLSHLCMLQKRLPEGFLYGKYAALLYSFSMPGRFYRPGHLYFALIQTGEKTQPLSPKAEYAYLSIDLLKGKINS